MIDIQIILRSLVSDYLKNVAKVSQTLYERDIKKAKQDRFIIMGLHESLHYVRYDKVLCVFYFALNIGLCVLQKISSI